MVVRLALAEALADVDGLIGRRREMNPEGVATVRTPCRGPRRTAAGLACPGQVIDRLLGTAEADSRTPERSIRTMQHPVVRSAAADTKDVHEIFVRPFANDCDCSLVEGCAAVSAGRGLHYLHAGTLGEEREVRTSSTGPLVLPVHEDQVVRKRPTRVHTESGHVPEITEVG